MSQSHIKELKLTEIYPNPKNPRKHFDEAKLNELAASIKEVGVVQPVVVVQDHSQGKYRLVVGERRWRASAMAEVETIPAIIKDLNMTQELEIMNIENLQREDISPIEEAQGFLTLLQECNYTQEELAKRIGRTQSHIANRIRLLNLPPEIQQKIDSKEIAAGHGVQLVSIKNKDVLNAVVEKIEKQGLPVAETKKTILQIVHEKGKPLYESYNESPLFDVQGCQKCEHKREGIEPYSFGGEATKPYCLNHKCWNKKQTEAQEIRYQENIKKTGNNGKEIVDLSKVSYSEREEYNDYYFKGIDRSECDNGCEFLKLGKPNASTADRLAKLYCFNMSCFRKKKMAATREANKIERQRKNAELEEINVRASQVAPITAPNKDQLVWIVLMILASVRNDTDRPTLFRYIKEKFGWEQECWKYPHDLKNRCYDEATSLLSSLPEQTLYEMMIEWPCVAEGLYLKCNKHILQIN